MRYFNRDILIMTIMVLAVMFVSSLIFYSFSFFDPFVRYIDNFRVTDLGFEKIGGKTDIADSNIAIFQLSNDYKNEQIAELLDFLKDKNTKVIGICEVLKKSDDPEGDSLLADAMKKTKNIVLASRLTKYNKHEDMFKGSDLPDKMFLNGNEVGFVNLSIGENKEYYTVRDFRPVVKVKNGYDSSFAYKVIKAFDPEKANILMERNNDKETIFYKGHFTRYYSQRYIDFKEQGTAVDFENKIVLIGKADFIDGLHIDYFSDLYFTPMNSEWSGKSFPDMYNMDIQTNIVSMLNKEEYIQDSPGWLNYMAVLAVVIFNMFLFNYISVKNKKLYEASNLIIFIVETVLLFYISSVLFHSHNININLTPAVFAVAISILVYEGYVESLKPLTIKLYYQFIKKR